MPTFAAVDGVNIYYEVAGQGAPLLLSHEFAGDITSWEPQVNFFTRRYQVITYCHRGYHLRRCRTTRRRTRRSIWCRICGTC